MKCKNPFMRPGQAYGCGQCLPCRIKIGREWMHRQMLEASLTKESAFVTLTYNDDHLPKKNSLAPGDLKNFLKRFRAAISPLEFRFYAVGEYGELHHRPHYHLNIFGLPVTPASVTLLSKAWMQTDPETGVKSSMGFVEMSAFNMQRAAYAARYTIKKLTDPGDVRLDGRYPEFSRQSLKPGLGYGMIPAIASVITRYNLLSPEGDVPVTLRHGSRELPLGRYLRRHLRMYLNGSLAEYQKLPATAHLQRARVRAKGNAPHVENQERDQEMHLVRYLAINSKENPSQKFHLLRVSEGEIRKIETRYKIYKSKGQL